MSSDNRFIIPSSHHAPSQIDDNSLVDLATGQVPGDHDEFVPALAKGGVDNRKEWGNVFSVQAGASTLYNDGKHGPIQPALTTPNFPIETDCTLIIQVKSPTNYYQNPIVLNALLAVVTYSVGAVSLTKLIQITDLAEKRVQLCCRNVQVSFIAVDLSGTATTVQVAVAVVPGHTLLRDAYLWSPGNILDGVSHGILWPGNAWGSSSQFYAGVVGAATIVLESNSVGAPLYGLFFDEPSSYSLVGGESPIQFGVSGSLSQPGDFQNFSGIGMPEGLSFSQGLQFALSTTAGSYTAPSGSPTAHVSVLVGQ